MYVCTAVQWILVSKYLVWYVLYILLDSMHSLFCPCDVSTMDMEC